MIDLIDVNVELVHETELAYLVRDDDDTEHWLPKSQCSITEQRGDYVTIELPAWLAENEGLA